MERLGSRMNLTISHYRESALRLSKNPTIRDVLFSEDYPDKKELSKLYNTVYKELTGGIENASIHLVHQKGTRLFSTHVVPDIFNPNSSDPSLSTYAALKRSRTSFPIVDSFINPAGDTVGLSLFHLLSSEDQSAYLIYDLNARALADEMRLINAGFFTDIYLLDNITYKFVNLFREDESGNFSGLDWRVPSGESGVLISGETLVAYKTLYPEELTLVGTLTLGTVTANIGILIRIILAISLAGLVLASLMAMSLARTITQPLTGLVEAMKKMEEGDLTVRMDETNGDEFDILIHGFNDMALQIHSLLEMRVEKEKALRTAERQALQSQINPHFLYNTLNTVKALSKLHGVEDITLIITQLGKLLRNAMDSGEELGRVKDSIDLVEGYLQIQKVRYGKNFNWSIEIEDELLEQSIPRLILQPVVENSVIHGLENLTGERWIHITGSSNPPCIEIADNGNSLNGELWQKALNGEKGIGLCNVNKRLKLFYGDEAGLSYTSQRGMTIIRIRWTPLEEETNED